MKNSPMEKPEASREVKRKPNDRQQREDRLADALRANLRRRKSRARPDEPRAENPEPWRQNG